MTGHRFGYDPKTHRLTLLRVVTTRSQELAPARRNLADAVERARAAGATWAEIGSALGITRQAAYQRFGRDGER